jgi:hypothetical protein
MCLHTATGAHALRIDFARDVFFHPTYSSDLAPSDFHLFTHLKRFWGSTCMGSDEEMKMVKDWFSEVAADLNNAGIQKFVTQYNKYQNLHGIM